VLAGAAAAPAVAVEDLVEQVGELVAGGRRLKEAVAELAADAGVSRKALYDAVLAARAH